MGKEIPNNWITVQLDDVAYKITDGTHKTPKYQEKGIRFISIKNIRPFKPINYEVYEKYISREEHNMLIKRAKPEIDDILFPRIGTLGFAKRIDWEEEFSIFVGLGLVKPVKKYVLPKFIEYYLNSSKIFHLSHEKSTGTGRMTLPLKESKKLPFPLPPLPEQNRIVDKLDAIFGHLEQLKTKLDKIPGLLKNFRQAVLNQAVTGKLTEEWGEGRELGECQLEYYVSNSFYGPRFGKNEYSSSGFPTVRTTDMTKNGFIQITDETPRVVIDDFKKLELYKISKGDLLVTRTGSIGKMARYTGTEIAIPSAYLIRFRFNNKALTDFIFYCLMSPSAQNQMGLSSTAITQPNLNAQKIRALKVPKMSIEEQKIIVIWVQSLFSKADKIEQQYQTIKEKIDQLPQAILAKAFKGELVEQLPTDGDAKDLLEQIQKAKTELEKKGKTKPGRGKTRKMKKDEDKRMVAEPRGRYGK